MADGTPGWRRIAASYADRDLAAHPHRLVLSGQPGDMRFPPLCPNCGDAATERIQLDKVFERGSSDEPSRYEHVSVWLPVCTACAARNQAQARPQTPVQQLLSGFANFDMVGAVVLVVAALFVAWLALKDVFKGRFVAGLLLLGFAALLALFAEAQRRAAWDATAHHRVPEPSEVGRAFDFSDDLAKAFEKPRYAVAMKNAAFAKAFEAVNAAQLYRADSAAAVQEARGARRKTLWLVAGLVLLALVLGWFGY